MRKGFVRAGAGRAPLRSVWVTTALAWLAAGCAPGQGELDASSKGGGPQATTPGVTHDTEAGTAASSSTSTSTTSTTPTSTLPDETDTAASEDCAVLEVGFDGADPPRVGDVWTVWPVCDGVVVMGASVVRLDPVDGAAEYEENELTFLYATHLNIEMQVGHQRTSMDVVVGD
jgi:hypothetical protein